MTNPRYANGYRRRQLRARILREEEVCWICDEVVDKELSTPHPLSPEVHEIIPIAHGGDPLDRTNCTLSHRVCNQCLGTGQHRGFCIRCLRADGVDGYSTADGYGTDASGRRGHINPAPGVHFVTWRTW
ncbi:HNH endonuclease signature motif containing protein [Mycobacterium intracellulare]|uniref:HNH endonuclease signature motif containing protein n=1 Tax=Mycobacterium intracellulare TaxID=1767 RepID=UPI0035588A7A